MISAIASWDADVVALQEVTPPVLAMLLESAVVRRYEVSLGAAGAGYGVVLLSRQPFSEVVEIALPTMMGRTALVGIWRAGSSSLALATAHLESTVFLRKTRVEQLTLLSAALDPFDTAPLVGDMNFDPKDPEESARDPRFLDVWPALRGNEVGWTEDTEVNVLRLLAEGGEHKQVRYDRALLRGNGLRPTRIALVGNEPFGTVGPCWLSDHFGLVVDLEVAP